MRGRAKSQKQTVLMHVPALLARILMWLGLATASRMHGRRKAEAAQAA
jgi:hypothetical protein